MILSYSRLVYREQRPAPGKRLIGDGGACDEESRRGRGPGSRVTSADPVKATVGPDGVATFVRRRVLLEDPPVIEPEPHALQYTAKGIRKAVSIPLIILPSCEPHSVRAFRGHGATAAPLNVAENGAFLVEADAGSQVNQVFLRC
jgi:hypothetical protein